MIADTTTGKSPSKSTSLFSDKNSKNVTIVSAGVLEQTDSSLQNNTFNKEGVGWILKQFEGKLTQKNPNSLYSSQPNSLTSHTAAEHSRFPFASPTKQVHPPRLTCSITHTHRHRQSLGKQIMHVLSPLWAQLISHPRPKHKPRCMNKFNYSPFRRLLSPVRAVIIVWLSFAHIP